MSEVALPEQSLNPHLAQWCLQAIGRALATWAILQGINIIGGGPFRWSAPAFQTALSLPGAPDVWGWFLLGSGLIALSGSLLGRRDWPAIGFACIMAWCFFFALAFLDASRNPTSSTTGIGSYAVLAVVSGVLAAAYRKSNGPRRTML